MWRGISLRHRLNLLFAALLLAWLAVDVARMLMEAGPRARAQSESMTRLVTKFVATALANVQQSPDPMRDLSVIVENLSNLRNVRVRLVSYDGAVASAFVTPDTSAPAWFRAIANAPIRVVTIPVVLKQHQFGSVLIVADPSDEIEAVWSAVQTQAIGGVSLALSVLFASGLFIRQALRPLTRASAALARLETGDYSARAEPSGSPEFVDVCFKINSLAGSLRDLRATNEQLIDRLLDVQDAERKTIAHELHDEIGPHLFTLRAKAAVLASRLEDHELDGAVDAASIRDQIEALQEHNKRILSYLRPVALEELGLLEALEALIEQWRDDEPNVTVSLSADPRVGELGERASLMAYRFVQEALTNAFRHSRSRRVEVSLSYAQAGDAAIFRDPALSGLQIRVADDGQGIAAHTTPGMGIVGMRERVRALGGKVEFGDGPNGGAVVEARFDRDGFSRSSGNREERAGINELNRRREVQ